MSKGYFHKLLVAADQFLNVLLLNGSEDHTISGRIGYKALTVGAWYWLMAERIIDTIFFFDKKHCRNSIEWQEVEGELSDFESRA